MLLRLAGGSKGKPRGIMGKHGVMKYFTTPLAGAPAASVAPKKLWLLPDDVGMPVLHGLQNAHDGSAIADTPRNARHLSSLDKLGCGRTADQTLRLRVAQFGPLCRV